MKKSLLSQGLSIFFGMLIILLFTIKLSYAQETTEITLNINPGTLTINAPASGLHLGTLTVGQTGGELQGTFTGADFDSHWFRIQDLIGNDIGRNIHISASDLIGQGLTSGNHIPASNISIMNDDNPALLEGLANSNIYMASTFTGNFASLSTTPQVFMYKNNGTNFGRVGKYGAQPSVKVAIPPFQTPGSYKGTIIITLIH